MPNLTAGTDDIRGVELPGDSIRDLTGAVPDGGDVQPSHDQPINPLPTAHPSTRAHNRISGPCSQG